MTTACEEVTKAVLKTPIGSVKVVVTNRGIKEIILDPSFNDKVQYIDIDNPIPVALLKVDGPSSEVYKSAIEWIKVFFDPTKASLPQPPLDNNILIRNNFTGIVLQTLMNDTKPGERLSYAELALRCGSAKACRAVGQAMRANPIPLIVPCHRVVASNGGLGHYMSGRGDNIKAWLLKFEQIRTKA